MDMLHMLHMLDMLNTLITDRSMRTKPTPPASKRFLPAPAMRARRSAAGTPWVSRRGFRRWRGLERVDFTEAADDLGWSWENCSVRFRINMNKPTNTSPISVSEHLLVYLCLPQILAVTGTMNDDSPGDLGLGFQILRHRILMKPLPFWGFIFCYQPEKHHFWGI